MDFNTTVDLILKDLNEARDIIDDLKNYPGVPVIQVELAKSKCKSAGEVIALLKTFKREEVIEAPELKTHTPAPVKQRVVTPERKPEESIRIGDTFGLTDRLNEQMGSMRDDDNVSDILKTKPIINLADAIGVNDKFLFIREIFKGNPESFEQAITKLDNAASYSDAQEVLRSYTGSAKETGVVKQLMDLVKRKFPAYE